MNRFIVVANYRSICPLMSSPMYPVRHIGTRDSSMWPPVRSFSDSEPTSDRNANFRTSHLACVIFRERDAMRPYKRDEVA